MKSQMNFEQVPIAKIRRPRMPARPSPGNVIFQPASPEKTEPYTDTFKDRRERPRTG